MSCERFEEQEKRFMDVMQRLDRVYEEYAKASGISCASLTVLDVLYETGGCTQKDICARTLFPKQSVNIIIKSFLQSGYIQLRELPADRRNKRVTLTQKGFEYADGVAGSLRRVDDAAARRLTDSQREQLLELMGIYEAAYSEGVRALIKGCGGEGKPRP